MQVIHLTTATAQEGYVDSAPTGEINVGDSLAFSEDLFKGSKKIGDAGGGCTTCESTGQQRSQRARRRSACPTARS